VAGSVAVVRTILRGLATLGEAILVALALPVVILAVGTPIALVVRLALEIARAL
jgi:hypothetical protein